MKRMVIVLGLVLLAALIVWAAAELSGQINQLAQDTGAITADSEIITLELIRKPAGVQGNWDQEGKIRKDILAKQSQYSQTTDKALKEMKDQGQVSEATQEDVRKTAASFREACAQYSTFWKGAGQPTRADLATAVGASRLAGAAVAAGGMNAETQKTLRDHLQAMGKVRNDYVRQAIEKNEISDADREDIHATLEPRVLAHVNRTKEFTNRVTDLLTQIQRGLRGGGGACRDDTKAVSPETTKEERDARDLDRTGRGLQTDAISLESATNSFWFRRYSLVEEPPSSRICPFCFVNGE